MALSRSFLTAMGIEAEKVDEIIKANADSISGLKDKIAMLEEKAEKVDKLQKKLDDLKTEQDSGKNPYKVKYDALKEEYDAYKQNTENEAKNRAKTAALRTLLKDVGISEKRLDAVIKVTSLDDIELDEKGELKNAADLKKTMKTEWADFITVEEQHGVNPANPPANNGGVLKTRADIYKTDEHGRFLMDAAQRQEALSKIIAEEQQKGN